MLTLHVQDNKTFFLLCKNLENPKFFAFFFGKKKGLQKFRGKFYVLAALWNCVLSRRFGNPLQKFFYGFGFVEFLMRSAPLPKGVWGWSVVLYFPIGVKRLAVAMDSLRVRTIDLKPIKFYCFLASLGKRKYEPINFKRTQN
jgi:hypothetical protein